LNINLSIEGFPQTVCLHLPTYYSPPHSPSHVLTGILKFNVLPQISLGAPTRMPVNTQPSRDSSNLPFRRITVPYSRAQGQGAITTCRHLHPMPSLTIVPAYGGLARACPDSALGILRFRKSKHEHDSLEPLAAPPDSKLVCCACPLIPSVPRAWAFFWLFSMVWISVSCPL
jgi:hypothetical protein